MRSKVRRLRSGAAMAALLLVSTPGESTTKEEKARLLTRSIYLPVEFRLCEHLEDAVLFEGEQAVSLLPAKRIFQFTFYPALDRIEPMRTDVRVEGVRTGGEPFIGKLAVTPWGVFTASRKVELDIEEQLAKMRFKLDVRYETLALRIRCSESCEKHPGLSTADADASSSH